MFNKKNRLAGSKNIQLVLRAGRNFFNPDFSVKYHKDSKDYPSFTIVVSTKVSKLATKRNRLKRILREYLKKRLTKIFPGNYMVFIKPKRNLDEKLLLASLDSLLRKNRMIKD